MQEYLDTANDQIQVPNTGEILISKRGEKSNCCVIMFVFVKTEKRFRTYDGAWLSRAVWPSVPSDMDFLNL